MQAVWIPGGDMMGHPMLGRQSVRNCPTWRYRGYEWLVGLCRACEEAKKKPERPVEILEPTKGLVGYGEK